MSWRCRPPRSNAICNFARSPRCAIEFQRDDKTYRFGPEFRGQKYELPGLWFDQKELYSLLMSYQLLSGLDPRWHSQPPRFAFVGSDSPTLGQQRVDSSELMRRVRIVQLSQARGAESVL